jgi:uncharacterized protein (DUF1800 family)
MPLSASDAAHFCRRVGFAGTADELAHFTGREIPDVVDEVVNHTPTLPGRPNWYNTRDWWEAYEPATNWWYDRMVRASWVNRGPNVPSPLIERMSLFWHSHFACGLEKVESMKAMFDQNNLFREHGLGDFETLVQTVSVSGAMLRYIDNETNVKGAEQENFARELMELHTIGVGNFTEPDVIAMAKAWTGHNIVGWVDDPQGGYMDATYRFYPEYHDEGNKTLFGITRNWDGPDTVTELVKGSKQQATARYVTRKLWKFFVNSTPSDTAINELAGVWIANGMQTRELMRAMLNHAEFWAPASRWAIVRSPGEWVVDVLRRTGLPPNEAGLAWIMGGTGHELYEPPNVAGWGTHGYWVSTATAWGKGRFVGFIRWNERFENTHAGLESMSRTQAVDYVMNLFGITEPSTASRQKVGAWFDNTKARHSWALKRNVLMIGPMLPEFQAA